MTVTLTRPQGHIRGQHYTLLPGATPGRRYSKVSSEVIPVYFTQGTTGPSHLACRDRLRSG